MTNFIFTSFNVYMPNREFYISNPKNNYMKLPEPKVGVVSPPHKLLQADRMYYPMKVLREHNKIQDDVYETKSQFQSKKNRLQMFVFSAVCTAAIIEILLLSQKIIKFGRKLLRF